MASYSYTFQSGDGVTPTRLNDARTVSDIVNADIKSDAAIAGTKIAPDFGQQDVSARDIFSFSFSETNAAVFRARKARGTSASPTIVQSGDPLGAVNFQGYDGTNYIPAAVVRGEVDGTPGTNDMPGRLLFLTTPDGGSTQTERMRINSSGKLFVGASTDAMTSRTNTGAYFQYVDGVGFYATNSGATCLNVVHQNTGNQVFVYFGIGSTGGTQTGSISTNGTSTAYNTSSDYRLKENPQPMVGALSRLSQVNPVTFTWKSNGSQGEGFIAHELQAVVPEAVTGEKDAVDAEGAPQYQGVDASKLVPLLVSAVQELSAKVAALEAAQ